MARLTLSSAAYDDAEAIIRDLSAKAGVFVATRYRSDFAALFRRLTQFPDSGAPRPNLGPEVRIGVVAPYLAIYEYSGATDTVAVLRIVHGSRKNTRRLLPHGPWA